MKPSRDLHIIMNYQGVITLHSYPVGLIPRTNYFRVTDTVWNQEAKDFILSRMKASVNNIKPIIIINHVTKKTSCEFPNDTLTAFESHKSGETDLWCLRVERIANWHLKKEALQNSNMSIKDKETNILLLEKKYLRFETLTTKEEKAFNKFVKEL